MEPLSYKETFDAIQKHHDESGTYWCPFSRRFITPGVPEIIFIDSIPLLAPPKPPISDETKQILRQVLQDLRQLSIEYPPQIREMVHRTRFPEYGGLGEMADVYPIQTPGSVLDKGICVRFEMQRKASDSEPANMVFKVVKSRTSNNPQRITTYVDGHLRFDDQPEFGDDRPVQSGS